VLDGLSSPEYYKSWSGGSLAACTNMVEFYFCGDSFRFPFDDKGHILELEFAKQYMCKLEA